MDHQPLQSPCLPEKSPVTLAAKGKRIGTRLCWVQAPANQMSEFYGELRPQIGWQYVLLSWCDAQSEM